MVELKTKHSNKFTVFTLNFKMRKIILFPENLNKSSFHH